MSNAFPGSVDAWRMVQARRSFKGTLPLANLSRLAGSLATTKGEVVYHLQFDRDELGTAYVHVQVEARLSLVCQRTLEPFIWPVTVDVKLGLVRNEDEESSLPANYEALLVDTGLIQLADIVEDELILAIPIIAVKPGTSIENASVEAHEEPVFEQEENPFAVLSKLKRH